MGDVIFALQDVYFSYLGRYPVLSGATMDIKRGEKITVMGANGTGKSTLLMMLDGLFFPDRGSVAAFGKALTEAAFNDPAFSRDFRSRVGLVFQNPDVQLFCPTVREDILFGPLQLGVAADQAQRRLDELVRLLDIRHLVDRPVHQLSVGEKRKVAIASTLAVEPEVIILDEPTAGLDPLTCRHIVDFIIEANAQGKTIITATHDLHIVCEISDAVYLLTKDKKVTRYGNPDDLLADRKALQENNLIHIHRHRHQGSEHAHPHYHFDHHHEEA
ncbi:MAG TPA: ABC transporter ATP-binding protein [Patescibacteria group bacterium]|nr:ABC transporter ATP-binding protein [Patescibacteria group bacterium]